ncbi:Fe-S cluster assembly protein NifU [Deltaproteobacteria bacterium OttesenSCG-928-M10]|nr:Fe-S cluster assembly protein NifU [Deltaproteobacteria bacterium OttesenSCG-928-M10]
MWDYTEKVKDHFENPRNVGVVGRVDGDGQVGSLSCGDALRLTIQVDKASDRIEDAKFQTFGCASAIASSSAMTEMIKGKTLDEAMKVTNQEIADYLGGLPKEKMHCSVLGREALEAAVANYRGVPLPQADSPIVCECFGVTEKEIERVVRENSLTTVEDITAYTKAGGGCGRCIPDLEKILERVLQGEAAAPAPAKEAKAEAEPKKLTFLQKARMIEDAIQHEIAPALMRDGGDIELVDIDGDEVLVTLKGACATCPSSKRTLADFVTEKLRELVSDKITVREVRP